MNGSHNVMVTGAGADRKAGSSESYTAPTTGKRLLILQNVIMEYRRPVYNGLAEWYDVTVLHSGTPTVTAEDRYREIIVPEKQVGPFDLNWPGDIRGRIGAYDVVIAMFGVRSIAFWLPLLGSKRPKYILWGHRYSGSRVGDAFRDWLMRKADRLLMYGDEEIEEMVRRGADRAKIVVAPNTIDVPNHRDFSGAEKSSLLFVGRLQPLKRIDLLIDVFARLRGRIPNGIVLDIVGSGAIEADLRRQAANAGVGEMVKFHGRIDEPEKLCEFFARALAYVSPSPVGLGVLHSFAYGVPVLTVRKTVDVPHGPEFLNLQHDHNSIICETLADVDVAIERICTESGLAARLGHNAYRRYAGERNLDRMLAGFRQAIDH